MPSEKSRRGGMTQPATPDTIVRYHVDQVVFVFIALYPRALWAARDLKD